MRYMAFVLGLVFLSRFNVPEVPEVQNLFLDRQWEPGSERGGRIIVILPPAIIEMEGGCSLVATDITLEAFVRPGDVNPDIKWLVSAVGAFLEKSAFISFGVSEVVMEKRTKIDIEHNSCIADIHPRKLFVMGFEPGMTIRFSLTSLERHYLNKRKQTGRIKI